MIGMHQTQSCQLMGRIGAQGLQWRRQPCRPPCQRAADSSQDYGFDARCIGFMKLNVPVWPVTSNLEIDGLIANLPLASKILGRVFGTVEGAIRRMDSQSSLTLSISSFIRLFMVSQL